MKQQWDLHICALDRFCHRYAGWLWRVEWNTPWWHLGIALWPNSRYVGKPGDDLHWFSWHRHNNQT